MTLTEAAQRLEYDRKAVAALVRREGIAVRRDGTARRVPWVTLVEAVAARVASVSLTTLAATLGTTRQRLTRHLRRAGMLRVEVERGVPAELSPEDAERCARYWRRHAAHLADYRRRRVSRAA